MKKTVFSVAAIGLSLMLAGCGTAGGSLLGGQTGSNPLGTMLSGAAGGNAGSTAMDALSSIISTFAGGILTNQATIVGTWNYTQPCVQFESENLLAQAGGSVVAGNVSKKLATYYQMVGIKPGACTCTFNKDNTCTMRFGSYDLTGTYVFNASNRTMTITTNLGMKITAYVSVSVGKMGLTFDASKLLSLVGGSAASSSLGVVSSLIGNYNGMKIGFEFSK